LGINMPARSVVLERLVKWNGEAHVDLTAGEYTQLTGRAGRRGIDIEGHAVVVWSDELDPEVLAGLASTRTYPLRSSFQASYNMAINLVGQMGRAKAREVLETSFAQFQADQSVVGLSAEVRKLKEAQAGYAESMHCHLGDFTEYAALREEITQKEKNAGRTATAQLKSGAEECLARMRPGDVFVIPRGKRSGPAVVIASADRPHDPRPQVLTHERQVRRVSTVDVPIAVPTLGRIKVPKNFSAKDATMRRDLARKAVSVAEDADHRTPPATSNHDDQVSAARARMRAHPCHGCQDREAHARWAERYFRAQRQIADLERRIATRTHSIARQFDRVCETLVDLGYLEGQGDDLRITESGRMLGGLYSESDLLIAQCLKAGQWNDLQPAELAAVVACVVYQSRRSEGDIRPAVPGGPVETAVDELFRTWATLSDVERAHRLPPGSEPDAGLAWAIYRWAKGASLLTILTSNDVSAGDFVRWTRQVIDVLGQIHQAAGDATLRDIADRAAAAIDRGVVGYTPVLE
jgi:ATP-dependent RNA helicase HelY